MIGRNLDLDTLNKVKHNFIYNLVKMEITDFKGFSLPENEAFDHEKDGSYMSVRHEKPKHDTLFDEACRFKEEADQAIEVCTLTKSETATLESLKSDEFTEFLIYKFLFEIKKNDEKLKTYQIRANSREERFIIVVMLYKYYCNYKGISFCLYNEIESYKTFRLARKKNHPSNINFAKNKDINYHWILDYLIKTLKEKHELILLEILKHNIATFAYDDKKKDLDPALAFPIIDLLRTDEGAELFFRKLKSAISSKKHRHKNKDKKNINIAISKEAKTHLELLCKSKGLKQSEVIEKLILNKSFYEIF